MCQLAYRCRLIIIYTVLSQYAVGLFYLQVCVNKYITNYISIRYYGKLTDPEILSVISVLSVSRIVSDVFASDAP